GALYLLVPLASKEGLVVGALVLVAGLLVPLVGALLVGALLFRVVARRPSLVVGPEGIRDGGSLLVTGVGLLRWQELLGVTTIARARGRVTVQHLGIRVTDIQAIRHRQPLGKRLASPLFGWRLPATIAIAPVLLDRPADALAQQITQYVQTHAPAD